MSCMIRMICTTSSCCRGGICSLHDLEHGSRVGSVLYRLYRTQHLVTAGQGLSADDLDDLYVDDLDGLDDLSVDDVDDLSVDDLDDLSVDDLDDLSVDDLDDISVK